MTAPHAIAIVGMAGRFPGAANVAALWRNLMAGVESISTLTDEQLRRSGLDPDLTSRADYVKAAPLVDGIDLFDAAFFRLSPRDAALLDPQHRVFLECAWEALEDAGHVSGEDARIGVFAGCSMSSYLISNLFETLGRDTPDIFDAAVANDKDFFATRVSYKLDLRGPAVSIQTACSTSLVAVHAACQSLLTGECDLAIAGGVTIRVPQEAGYRFTEGSILSPDGHCRPFDAEAQGTVFGNGAGAVVLRRLDDAVADGDRILAVIRGSAVNNDGGVKAGFTAPSVTGQAAVVAEALAVAGVDPHTIGCIEAHGTGTRLGDPIEIAALARVFGPWVEGRTRTAIGSIKGNIGHLDAAAGVAGLIKAVLMLHHGVLVPTLHVREPNPEIDWERVPFTASTELRPWPASQSPRRAGVSSFGIGGTNAHVVLEEAPGSEPSADDGTPQVLVVSARTPEALDAATAQLTFTGLPLADAAWTLQRGRHAFRHRRAAVARSAAEGAERLRQAPAHVLPAHTPRVVFLFPGPDARYAGMGRDLHEREPVYRETLETCLSQLREHGIDLRDLLFSGDDAALRDPRIARAAVFATELGLARLWMSWGVAPAATIGHSIGELVAACIADGTTLDAALRVIAEGAELPAAMPAGAELEHRLRSESPSAVLLEVGPGRTLSALARHILGGDRTIVSSLGDPGHEQEQLREAVARLWTAGVGIDWRGLHADARRRRVALPTYPFERQRCWIDAEPPLQTPVWTYAPRPAEVRAEMPGRWLLAGDIDGLAEELAGALRARGERVVRSHDLTPPPDLLPARVVILGSRLDSENLASALPWFTNAKIEIVTRGTADVAGEADLRPEAAALLGLRVRVIDLLAGAGALLAELAADRRESHVALRGRERWVSRLTRCALREQPLLRPGGRYAVAGRLDTAVVARLRERGCEIVQPGEGPIDGLVYVPAFAPMQQELRQLAAAAAAADAGQASLRLLLLPSTIDTAADRCTAAALETAARDRRVLHPWTVVTWDGVELDDLQRVDPAAGVVVIRTHAAAGAAPASVRPFERGPVDAPRTEIEQRIAAIWEELLGVRPVGIHDDFFALGGHSLVAVQIVARIRAAYPVALPLERLIGATTVAALARLVDDALLELVAGLAEEDIAQLLEGL
ncbi:MAG TPA: beta-ketoacyl synthase N-terminal-like domain-containing protein [Thermoanaerobaculia bacterium]